MKMTDPMRVAVLLGLVCLAIGQIAATEAQAEAESRYAHRALVGAQRQLRQGTNEAGRNANRALRDHRTLVTRMPREKPTTKQTFPPCNRRDPHQCESNDIHNSINDAELEIDLGEDDPEDDDTKENDDEEGGDDPEDDEADDNNDDDDDNYDEDDDEDDDNNDDDGDDGDDGDNDDDDDDDSDDDGAKGKIRRRPRLMRRPLRG